MKKKLFLMLMIFLCSFSASADVVSLDSGKTMEGLITKLTDTGITLNIEKKTYGIPYNQIKEIRESIGGAASNSAYIKEAQSFVLQIQEKEKERVAARPQPVPEKKIEIYIAAPQVDSSSSGYAPPINLSSASKKSNQVDVYVTSWCPYCQKLIAFLHENKIAHRSYDIEKDSSANEAYRQYGGRGVPLTVVGDQVIRGYNPSAILAAVRSK
ncbi:MAG: hypothetical protein NUV91_05135 [Candidatus Omnitrophica bacterium]|nr:hypothetical protein [Candidatus Omnitrophota bacterium]